VRSLCTTRQLKKPQSVKAPLKPIIANGLLSQLQVCPGQTLRVLMQVSIGGPSKNITQLLAGVACTKVGLMLQIKHSGTSFNRGDCGYCGLGPVELRYQWDNSTAGEVDWTAHEVP